MSEERAILKGHLADLRQKKIQLETEIAGELRGVKRILAASNITPIADIDIEGASLAMTRAAEMKKELADVRAKIEKAEAELNG